MIIENKEVVTKIVGENLLRTHLIIANVSNATIYIAKHEYADYDYYENNALPIKENGLLEISGVECYKGEFYCVTDTDDTDVRVLEL